MSGMSEPAGDGSGDALEADVIELKHLHEEPSWTIPWRLTLTDEGGSATWTVTRQDLYALHAQLEEFFPELAKREGPRA